MKKLISLLLCLCMVLSLLPTEAWATNDASGTLDSGLTWRVEDGTLTISGTGEMEEFSESTSAPWQALAEGITHIVVDNGVASIGSYAFCDCAAAEDVAISDSVTKIGTNVFKGCAALKGLTIPTSVERFGRFGEGCTSLVSLTLPVSLVKYGSFRTYEGNGREDLSTVKHLTFKGPGTLEGMIYRNKPLHFWALNEGIQIKLDGVTGLGYAALAFCDFKFFTIPDSVTTIGEKAFYECNQLRKIVIPAGVTSIGDEAFYGCGELRTARLNAAAELGTGIFTMCQKLSSVTLPEGLTKIPVGMFSCCGLTSVRLPSTLKRIGDNAFQSNPLRSVTIPSGVESIGKNAFASCHSLTEVSLPESLTDMEDGAFSDCQSLPQIIIPSGVTTLKGSLFQQCEELAMVEIPKGVTTIEDGVFYNCLSLREVWYPGSEEEWENISVASSGSGGHVYEAHANYSLLQATVHYGYTYAEWLAMLEAKEEEYYRATHSRLFELVDDAGNGKMPFLGTSSVKVGNEVSYSDDVDNFPDTISAFIPEDYTGSVTVQKEGYRPVVIPVEELNQTNTVRMIAESVEGPFLLWLNARKALSGGGYEEQPCDLLTKGVTVPSTGIS
ncbi:MAG: leucine-rich repeat protein, partial [Oscillospiraceae bacterium]|nr:leucine-rich repeat protein [Oscillospiraceae bacterium]